MAIIQPGLEAVEMRNRMESKEDLKAKGSLYVGTGDETTVTRSDNSTVTIPVTTAFIPETNGGVMIHDNSTSTGWKVDKVKAENLDNDSLAQICLNLIYPVGSIYMSVKNASPETFLGGTWVAWGSGKVPVGVDISDTDFNGVEKTGGKKTHVLTENEMPKHKHTGTEQEAQKFNIQQDSTFETKRYTASFTAETIQTASNSVANPNGPLSGYGEVVVEHGITAGGGQPHSILQPYITCYMWKRVS